MIHEAMKISVVGKAPLGPAAECFLHACRQLQAATKVPDTIACPPLCFVAPDVLHIWLTADVSDDLRNQVQAALAPLGARPLRVQPCSAGEDADLADPLPPAGFLANQGAPAERARQFLVALRALFNNTSTPLTLVIAALAGLQQGQRVFPLLSGTACASNPYAWSEYIDPQAGVARLALGLETALADTSGDNFTRTVALAALQRRPEADFDDIAQHSQRYAAILNLATARVEQCETTDLLKELTARQRDLLLASGPSVLAPVGGGLQALTFDRLLTRTDFIADLQRLLEVLSQIFNAPAEIAFTFNVDAAGAYQFQLHHARPMADWPLLGNLREQVMVGGVLNPARQVAGRPLPTVAHTTTIEAEVLLEAEGAVLGRSRRQLLDHLLYIPAEQYAQLPVSARFEVARVLGRLNRSLPAGRWALLGPGRWCTSSPELGLPTTFAEISRAVALIELVEMHSGLTPDVSRGIHIFNELVATDMLYLAIFPGNPHNTLARERLAAAPSRLAEVLPEAARWADVVRLLDARAFGGAAAIELHADSRRQRAIAYAAGTRQH
jgi:hypothetical protein